MKTYSTSAWSESLQLQTRKAVAQQPVTPDGCLHFKHPAMGYAYVSTDNLVYNRLILRSKNCGDEYQFPGIDALLQAGWAVD